MRRTPLLVLVARPLGALSVVIPVMLASPSAHAQSTSPPAAIRMVEHARVQGGAVTGVTAVPAYATDRVLVKLTPNALSLSNMSEDARRGRAPAGTVLGVGSIDAVSRDASVTGIRRSTIEVRDAALDRQLGISRWFRVDVPAGTDIEALVARYAALPDVEAATPDWRAFPAVVPNDPMHASHWGHNNTAQLPNYCWNCGGHASGTPVGTVGFDADAHLAWDGTQGYGSTSIIIAILDSGVDAGHPDLNQVAGYDYGDNDTNPDDDSAEPGHGTACAGVAAAIANNGLGAAGAAGGCRIMPLKVADSGGSLFFSYIQNGLMHAADNGAHVASMSFGAAISSDPATDNAIAYAYNAGVTLLAATGNENASTISYPAIHASVIGVGAASPCGQRKRSSSLSSEVNPGVSTDPNGYTCDGERWWGSNYGSTTQNAAGAVDLLAPTILPTTDIAGSAGYDPGNYSSWFNGTSCATPYAAGVCGLIKSKNPAWTPSQVRTQLVTTCVDVTSVESAAGWDRYAGAGMVNAAAAVGSGGPPPTQAYTTIPYSTGFESGALDQYWATAVTGNGRNRVLNTNTPHGGAWHLVQDDATSGGYSQCEAKLHLNLSGQTQVNLSFWWKEFGDETHTQDGVYFSNNGGTSYVKVQALNGASYTNNTWQSFMLDLDALAAANGLTLTSTFVVKFQQYDDYPITTDGFAFDDIAVTVGGGGGQAYTTIPYSTGFEAATLDQYWATASTGDGRNRILTTNGPHGGTRHLVQDDATSGTYNQNEAKLHLNLSGQTQVNLAFWWKEFGDETHTQDGVYFSSNGGTSYVKVQALNGASYTDNTWQSFTLDLDALAAANGLTLTSTFVVKFQQYDDYPITTDGFAFDDIAVTVGGGGGSYITAESEPNNDGANADGRMGTGIAVTGNISASTDDDWFYFDVATAGNVNIVLNIGSSADLDWYLYHQSDLVNWVARGYTVNNPESGSYNCQVARYYLRIDGYQGATSPYTVTITGGGVAAKPGREKDAAAPLVVALEQNAPNPFNPMTRIRYAVPREGEPVRLTVYDVSGREIIQLVNGPGKVGHHEAVWDGRNASGAEVSSGTYFYRLDAGATTLTRKMLLVK
jgi:subtilisin family serine protease